jgi:hypothetical protein
MVATFTPVTALVNGTTYTATITTEVKDLAGNSLQENFSWSFTTETIVSPNSNVGVKEVEKLHCFISSAEYGHSMSKYISLFLIVLGCIVTRLSTQKIKEKH